MGRLVDIEYVIKAVDKHTKDESEVVLDEDITVILEEVPTAFKNDDWIPCSERLPSKEECGTYGSGEFQVTIPQYDGNKTTVMDYEYTTVRGKEISRWKWNGRLSPWEVIAWKPLSEPFKE